jgi:hypothetical protein
MSFWLQRRKLNVIFTFVKKAFLFSFFVEKNRGSHFIRVYMVIHYF